MAQFSLIGSAISLKLMGGIFLGAIIRFLPPEALNE